MQFLSEDRYVANVAEGKVNLYGKRGGKEWNNVTCSAAAEITIRQPHVFSFSFYFLAIRCDLPRFV
jgi:hypothetical protein